MTCRFGLSYDAGLCYTPCPAGFKGVGPVCWGTSPLGWVECGMGSSVDSKVCGQTVFDQVSSVGNLALNIASLGGSKAFMFGKDAAKIAELKSKF